MIWITQKDLEHQLESYTRRLDILETETRSLRDINTRLMKYLGVRMAYRESNIIEKIPPSVYDTTATPPWERT